MVALGGEYSGPGFAGSYNRPPHADYNFDVFIGRLASGAISLNPYGKQIEHAQASPAAADGFSDAALNEVTLTDTVAAAAVNTSDLATESPTNPKTVIGNHTGDENEKNNIKQSVAGTGLMEQQDPQIADEQLPAVEQRFINSFSRLVRSLDLPEIMVLIGGRTVAQPENFRLIPIASRDTRYSLMTAWHVGPEDTDIRCTYGDSPPYHPFLDTRQAIGLVKANHLIAVAGAGINENGQLFIKQIQDVTGMRQPARGDSSGWEEFLARGLHDGFSWRYTLVAAWEEIARANGITAVIIQSYVNNGWSKVREKDSSYAYDDVAYHMGYKQGVGKDKKDWLKIL